MKNISKLAAAIATAVTLGATAVQAQQAAPTATPPAKDNSCDEVFTKGALISCLGAFDNDVASIVTVHKAEVQKATSAMAQSGASLSCLAVSPLEKAVSQGLQDLTTDVGSPVQAEAVAQVQALFAATAGCLDTISSMIDADGAVTGGANLAVTDLRAAAVTARAMADSLRAPQP